MADEVKDIQDISDLAPDPENANLGTERGLRMLDDSLREDGAGRSILVDKDGVTIAGAKTLERAADIGLPIRVIQTDGTELVVVQRTDLDLDGEGDDQVRARRMAYRDNRSSEVGLQWDIDQLLADVSAGVDLTGVFRQDEIDELLAEVREAGPSLVFPEDGSGPPKMELLPYEKYDYVLLTFTDRRDFERAQTVLGLEHRRDPGTGWAQHVGLNRVIEGAPIIERLAGRASHHTK